MVPATTEDKLSPPKEPCDFFRCPAVATEWTNYAPRGRAVAELAVGLCSLHWDEAMQQRGPHEDNYDASNRFVRKSLID